MNTALYIKHAALTAFNECGYKYKAMPGSICAFRKERKNGFSDVIFSYMRYPPRRLQITYFTTGIHEFPLNFDMFTPTFCPASTSKCIIGTSNLEEYIGRVVESSVNIIFPFIDNMYENCVDFLPEMSVDLAKHTLDRADTFSKKRGLSAQSARQALIEMQNIINSLNVESTMRKAAFYTNYDELINMAAYFGEILASSYGSPHCWEWRDILGQKSYVISAGSYNPLARIIDAWNFGSEVLNYSLSCFSLPT